VIDKVLVHRSMSTLEVLLIGLVTIAVFRGRAGRPPDLPVFAYDQPYRRRIGGTPLPASPRAAIAYFQSRRVGDSVARVRELENIRNFLTSSALDGRHRPAVHDGVRGR